MEYLKRTEVPGKMDITDCDVSQHNEINAKHFLFSLLKIKGLYMFRASLAHPQEALHKMHLVYCVPPEDVQVMLETCKGPYFLIN
jgi:hypothetical protein